MTPEPVRPESPGQAQEVSLWFLANVLLRRHRLVIGVALASAVTVGLLSYLSTRRYVATASFIALEPRTSQSVLSQLAPQIGLALSRGGASSPEFYASLLQSRELQRDVATTGYHLAGPPSFDGDLIRYFKIEAPNRGRAIMLGIRQVRGILSVRTDRSAGLVSFDAATDNAELSELIAKRFLELVNEYNLRRQQSQARAEREFFEQRLADAQQQLATAESVLVGFLTRNRTYESSPELKAEEGTLERQVSLRQQLFLSMSQYFELAKVEEVRNTPAIAVIQHPEGLVEPRARGTVTKSILALILGLMAGGFLALGGEHVRRLRGEKAHEYAEFRAGLEDAASGLRRALRREKK